MKYTRRITPANPEPEGSRLDSYERSDGAKLKGNTYNWYNSFRTPKSTPFDGLPRRLDIDLIDDYGLRTITFGNWVKQFDRLNFCALLSIALSDLEAYVIAPKTKNIVKGLGKKELTIDWGGRGKKGANGIFYSGSTLINLRRFSRPDKLLQDLAEAGINTAPYLSKYFEPVKGQSGGTNYQLNKQGYIWVLGSSGFGSFAHEYGHFLDNYLGRKFGAKDFFISGRGVLPVRQELTEKDILYAMTGSYIQPNIEAKVLMFQVFRDLYYDKKVKRTVVGDDTYYYPNENLLNLEKYCKQTGGKETYWLSFIEVWARLFEVFVTNELSSKGVTNTFLVGDAKKFEIQIKVVDVKEITKEVGRLCYPTPSSVKKVSKDIKAILDIFAKT